MIGKTDNQSSLKVEALLRTVALCAHFVSSNLCFFLPELIILCFSSTSCLTGRFVTGDFSGGWTSFFRRFGHALFLEVLNDSSERVRIIQSFSLPCIPYLVTNVRVEDTSAGIMPYSITICLR